MRHNLSEITATIKDRRTIYPEQYSDRIVHTEIINEVLSNASWAPTHGNTQPWRFTVFTEENLKSLGEFLSETYKKNTAIEDFKEMKFQKLLNRPSMSSVVVAVSMKRDPRRRILEIEEIEAVSCAIQNMYLTCTAYGIGGFWSSPKVMYTKDMNDYLGLDDEDKCLALFYMGYPKDEWPKGYRKPLEHIVNWIEK